MKRSVLKISERSLAITLPSEWIKKQGVKKGDCVEVLENNNQIHIDSQKVKEISINLEDSNVQVIVKAIVTSYHFGNDIIKLRFSKTAFDLKTQKEKETIEAIKETVNQLIGFEVVSETENSCIIKDVACFNGEEFKTLLRRSFLLINEFANDSYYCAKGEKSEDLKGKNVCIRKFVNYMKRYLNKTGKGPKTIAYNDLLNSLMMISTCFRVISRDKRKYSVKVLGIFYDIVELLNESYKNFYNFDFSKSSELLKKRKDIFLRFDFATKDDEVLGQRLAVVLNGIFNIVDSTMEIGFGGVE
jgi:phosphate uptake regulator